MTGRAFKGIAIALATVNLQTRTLHEALDDRDDIFREWRRAATILKDAQRALYFDLTRSRR